VADRSWPQVQPYPQSAENGTPNLDKLQHQQAEHDELEHAHQLLSKQCPWYEAVSNGEPAADFRSFCTAADGPQPGEGGALVKFTADGVEWVALTAHTAEASTVDKPTVPPGGPGLFHVKGMHLPPYIQHLWFHLVKEYGRKRAYGVAVGVVKKWAAGINPGGWKTKSGKGKRTHADVRAAAAKNVAEWEADRARAHAQHARTEDRDSHEVRGTVALTAGAGATPFDGDNKLPLPPTPQDAKQIFTAHRVNDIRTALAHAGERMGAARSAADPAARGYHMLHIRNHLVDSLNNVHQLMENFRTNYPAEGRELEAMRGLVGLAKSLTPRAKHATTAHLTETVANELTHAKRHADLMLTGKPEAEWDFNADHCQKHLAGASEHAAKLEQHLLDNYPAEARWLRRLTLKPGEPHTGAPALAGRSVHLSASLRLASGSVGGGSVVTAPGAMYDVIPPAPGGRYAAYGLNQRPSQTVSPSPPLPPKVKVPTPQEVLALVPQVPQCADISLSNTVRKFLETAAGKLQKGDELEALHMLRSTGTAVMAAHKADLGQVMPAFYTAGVFSAIPPAEQSSAGQAVLEGVKRRQEWRSLEVAVQGLADRIRKRFFHGQYNGPSLMNRLTTEDGMGAVDRVLLLAAQQAVTGKDVSFPAESDTSQEAKLLQPRGAAAGSLSPEASQELASRLSAVDRMRLNAYLTAAREARDNPMQASQELKRAIFMAKHNHAPALARCLCEWLEDITSGQNATWPAAVAQNQPGHGGAVSADKPHGANMHLAARLR